jgi:hypothetical protein
LIEKVDEDDLQIIKINKPSAVKQLENCIIFGKTCIILNAGDV